MDGREAGRLGISLKAKVLTLFLLMVVTTSAGFGWYFYQHSRRLMEEQIAERVRTIAWTLAFNARYAIITADQGVLEDLTRGVIRHDDVVHVAIFDGRRHLLLERWKEPDGLREDSSQRAAPIHEVEVQVGTDSGAGRVKVDPDVETIFDLSATKNEGSVGSVRVGISGARMQSALRRSMRSGFLIFAISLVLGLLGMIALLRYLITPIRSLSEQMSHVAGGDFGSRLPERRDDEIGQLARSFNRMTAGLQVSQATAKEAQEALMQSNRLAAVGEVAGQAAHEILNPLAAIYGRLENEQHELSSRTTPLLQVLGQIVSGWSTEYRRGGWHALGLSLRRSVPKEGSNSTTSLLDEDLGNLETIHASLKDACERREQDLSFLLWELERISRIVEGMRSLSRAGAHMETLEIHEVLSESIEILKHGFDKRGIQVDLESSQEQLWVRADRSELVQIFTNLLRNSIQAIESFRSRGEGIVRIGVATRNGTAEISVADNGPGIRPDVQAKIFEAAITTKGIKDGTGLGLRICRRLARGNRGDVRLFRSDPQDGTVMLVELPRIREE